MNTERRPRLRLLAACGAIALAGALAGCASQGSPGASGAAPTVTETVAPPTPSGATTVTATATASASATPSASSSSFRPAGCDTSLLKGSLKSSGAAAGSTYYALTLTNTGSKPCTLQGWPGTSFVDASGKQIGAAADFDRSTAHETVTLIPNGGAVAQLQVAQALNFPKAKCDPVSAKSLRIYPPGSKASLLVSTGSALTTCADSASHVLQVGALHATS